MVVTATQLSKRLRRRKSAYINKLQKRVVANKILFTVSYLWRVYAQSYYIPIKKKELWINDETKYKQVSNYEDTCMLGRFDCCV